MEFDQAKERVEELVPLLKYYTQKYFDDEQVVSDYEYDMLMRELKGIEAKYPKLIREDSPTQRVGGTFDSAFKKVKHNKPMLSLSNVYNEEEIRAFTNRVFEATDDNDIDYEEDLKTAVC